MTDHQPPPAVEAIGRLEYRARLFRQQAASARAYRDDQQTASDLEADADAIDAVLSELRHSVEREAGLRKALADLADVLRNSVKERDGPHRVKVEGVWHEGPLADVYVRTFDQIVGILEGLLLSPTPPSTGAEK